MEMKEFIFTKEMVKAVRTILGFKTDLRVELIGANKDFIYDFIDNYAGHMLGEEFLLNKLDNENFLSDSYEKAIKRFVNGVIEGGERKAKIEIYR